MEHAKNVAEMYNYLQKIDDSWGTKIVKTECNESFSSDDEIGMWSWLIHADVRQVVQ